MSIIKVAKAAGVSTATVSRVMNDLPGVRRETIALVRAAVEELNYKPRRPAQAVGDGGVTGAGPIRRRRRRINADSASLASGVGLRTRNIAVVTVGHSPAWLGLPVMAASLGGIQRGLSELGLRLILEEMRDPARCTPAMADRQVDGAIVFLSSDVGNDAIRQTFATIRSSVPAVRVMGTSVPEHAIDHVTADHAGIGQLAAAHLMALGCKRLAFVATEPSWSFVRLRGQAFLNRAADGNATSATAYLLKADERSQGLFGRHPVIEADLDRLVARIAADAARTPAEPLGIFVFNDFSLSFVHPLLAKHGLEIGRNVQVVSCDAEESRLSMMHPRPASIDPGADEIGFRAVVRLLARIQRPHDRPLTIHVAPRL